MMDKYKILLAEDDYNFGNVLKNYLEIKGYFVTLTENGKEALEVLKTENFDFCIVDIMMPVMDGFSLVKQIKKIDSKIPIIFLTARNMQEDIQNGLKLGADDYITKPFSMEELLLRIKNIIKRTYRTDNPMERTSVFNLGNAVFDFNKQLLFVKKEEIKLTSKESELLKLLCEQKNEVVDRNYALNRIWLNDSFFSARSMDVYVTKLRKILKKVNNVELQNVHGIGFKLIDKENKQ
ncbi:MAG: response regulator transcription factor [Bacteroidales bacterium]|nr:response regulator transcription factor [Bacteroidales bacterium]